MEPEKQEAKVGETVNVNIRTNVKSSKVFLLGVDKSVRLLDGSSDITRELLTAVLREPMKSSYRKTGNFNNNERTVKFFSLQTR